MDDGAFDLHGTLYKMKSKKIDQKKTYFLAEVVREGWLGSKSAFVCKRLIAEFYGILKPEYTGEGRSTRILLRGAEILKFINR